MKPISIICPCYNEEDNIKELYEKFTIVSNSIPIEVIFVDNGSRDKTRSVLIDVTKDSSFSQATFLDINLGYGGGILHGLAQASNEFIGWTHADLQTSPEDIILAYKELQKNDFNKKIYIKGCRKNRPILDSFLSCAMSVFETVVFGKLIYEVNAQPNIFHRSFYESWKTPPKDFSLDLFAYYMALRKKMVFTRIAVSFPSRKHGHSKWNNGLTSVVKFMLTTLKFSLCLRKKYFLK